MCLNQISCFFFSLFQEPEEADLTDEPESPHPDDQVPVYTGQTQPPAQTQTPAQAQTQPQSQSSAQTVPQTQTPQTQAPPATQQQQQQQQPPPPPPQQPQQQQPPSTSVTTSSTSSPQILDQQCPPQQAPPTPPQLQKQRPQHIQNNQVNVQHSSQPGHPTNQVNNKLNQQGDNPDTGEDETNHDNRSPSE